MQQHVVWIPSRRLHPILSHVVMLWDASDVDDEAAVVLMKPTGTEA